MKAGKFIENSTGDIDNWKQIGDVHGEPFGVIQAVTSMVEVSALIDSSLLVEVEADAVVTDESSE
ncbi:hypothetical protein [Haloprofundus salilacus]|uniref:hypothetical protein n=1 Tax=Haloprofundus salilacus TaxID=2876190 RepID=UPI001CCDEF47|nr:hypothetical protein [Haloprofundus salilacus]